MGGPVSCVWDEGFANPAFAATQPAPNASARVQTTDFDNGSKITSTQIHYVLPLRENSSGLQFSYFNLQADPGRIMLQGFPVADMSEEDISVHYGARLGSRLTAGIGLSPMSEITLNLAIPQGPTLMDIETESDYGARLGLAYELAPGDYFGVVYDYYQETAEGTGLALGGMARRVFHTDLLAVGASRHLRPDLLVAAEYQTTSTNDGDLKESLHGWHLGLEYQPEGATAVRAGLNDEHFTFGLGYYTEKW